MTDMPNMTLYRGSGEWSALYVNGTLDRVGDHYLADERIAELAGVEIVQSDDFLCGGSTRKDVAVTLEELNAYVTDRQERIRRAEQLRQQAAALNEEAARLLGDKKQEN